MIRTLLPIAGILVLGACASSRGTQPQLLSGVEQARVDSARNPYTDADVKFMSEMISHHAQALEMSKLAPSRGASPAIIRLTERIIVGQTDEINLMQTWLRDRNKPVPSADPKGMKMNMGGMEHHMLMPGMLTEAQMKQLSDAREHEFDRLFLTFMIQHHRGAVDMVKALFANRGAGQDETVFRFASDVNVDQTTEINRMVQMLLTGSG
jgi:uncharacterized protein (DUF305 family)